MKLYCPSCTLLMDEFEHGMEAYPEPGYSCPAGDWCNFSCVIEGEFNDNLVDEEGKPLDYPRIVVLSWPAALTTVENRNR